ncbi:DUF5590 domain-containing protein [Vagococcus lutrae]|uniref:DUF5590 domain-containing protein n=1 Tax=Vagococcus lutrae TaxID=81947 RepID=A0AAE9XMM6_9ENTE|nr:DUF5590 domain-containing protein [Vagococcus lutrae]WCG22064.1 DUF5590 domain-containing protein [Vagococcus lutrae]
MKKTMTFISVMLSLFILFSTVFYVRAQRPYRQVKQEAIEVAQAHTKLKHVDKFYWYNREEDYFSLLGRSEKGEKMYVIIPKSGEKIQLLDPEKGLSEYEALKLVEDEFKPHKLLKATIGLHRDIPTWEVVTQNKDKSLNYYLINFEDGQLQTVLENV